MLTELERLEKNIADTIIDCFLNEAENVTYAALVKARLELEDYLKEQQDNG